MAVKPLKTAPAPEKALDPMEFIEAKSPARQEPAPEPVKESSKKSERFFVYMDKPLLARLDRECKRRGIGRSVLLRQLAAEHLPE
ncbi:MAG TPA: ribbon-helix-helix domain-containing protein [Candidatus Acidoferrum sp.]|jgi:hypothetical protein|nr:ribbon-helix-helix domain-containing protein [Candidatus Acidoferrum sp.]